MIVTLLRGYDWLGMVWKALDIGVEWEACFDVYRM